MNQFRPVKMKVSILFAAILSICLSIYSGEHSRSQSYKNTPPQRLLQFMFLTDSNLVDGRRLLPLKDKIGLTPEQEKKIEDLVLEQEAFNIRCSAEIKIKEVRFASYLKAGKLGRKEMESYIREISAEKTSFIVNYVNYLLDVRELLTPRQLKLLHQIKEQRKKIIRKNPPSATYEN
jgi:Spy/CpxP family protein refolding chaperone